jgi:pimeloyl-ACP methyl ester carboxylesterase
MAGGTQPAAGLNAGVEYGPRGMRPGRPTLVFLPGAGGNRISCRGQTRPLDRLYNTLALEFPGHGRSPGPPLTSVDALAAWAVEALEQLDPPRPLFLAGYSLGGAAALAASAERPEWADGLVLMSTATRLGDHRLLDFDPPSLARTLHGPGADEQTISGSIEVLKQIPPETWRADLEAASRWDGREYLPRVKVPALVICGKQDRLTGPEAARALARGLPDTRLVLIPDTGHMMAVEKFREVNQTIEDFVEAVKEG